MPSSDLPSRLSRSVSLLGGNPRDLEEWLVLVYEAGVRNPAVTRAQLLAAAIPATTVDQVTAELVKRGLFRPGGGPDSWEAIPPDIALPAMAARMEQTAARARTSTSALSRAYYAARSRDSEAVGPEFQVLEGQQDLHNAVSTVLSSATRELRAIRDNSPRTAFDFAQDLSVHRLRPVAADGALISCQVTYDSEILNLPRAGEVLQARAQAGESFRFLGNIPFSVIVADDAMAIVDITSYDSSGAGSLFVTDRRVVLALGALVNSYWQLATPMAAERPDELDQRSAFILSLMAAGASDATIAEQARVSQRTVERTVRSLMKQLGAQTRFQAGVHASRRGWL